MFAIAALLCFVLALFKVSITNVDLVILGFCFLALHLIFGAVISWPKHSA